jgi:hypothetical protein
MMIKNKLDTCVMQMWVCKDQMAFPDIVGGTGGMRWREEKKRESFKM